MGRACGRGLRPSIASAAAHPRRRLCWTAHGTHHGDLMGVPLTHKQVTITGITLERLADGKIVEEWNIWDQLGLLQQLGAVPAPRQAAR